MNLMTRYSEEQMETLCRDKDFRFCLAEWFYRRAEAEQTAMEVTDLHALYVMETNLETRRDLVMAQNRELIAGGNLAVASQILVQRAEHALKKGENNGTSASEI